MNTNSSNTSKTLAPLPGMLARSVLTLRRGGQPAIRQLRAQYEIPALDTNHLEAYQHAFGGFVSELPLTYLYLSAQRAHLALMLTPEFPWPVPGMVHVSNAVTQLLPIDLSLGFTLVTKIKLPQPGGRRLRPAYCVEFMQGGDCVAVCDSIYQVMQPTPAGTPRSKAHAPDDQWQQLNQWTLPNFLGREYARLSGDYNPIHIHPWLSRWFGFRQPIIHGMYMSARAHAELEQSLKEPIERIDVTFKRPVTLPAQVTLWHKEADPEETDLEGRYQVRRTSDLHIMLEGSYRCTEPRISKS